MVGSADYAGEMTLINVWATWCVGCRQEHDYLLKLASETDIPIYGLNLRDHRGDALAWLRDLGDPYVASAFDEDGRVGIDWGVYGVPETFVIDANGIIRYKHIGPLEPDIIHRKILPLVRQLSQKTD